jgi:hypothetical protein
VSCPDWRHLDLAARGEASPQAARWEEALRHLDAGCPLCRREALAADPTLVFRLLPAPELTPAEEGEEVAAARQAVAAMRAASRLNRHGRESGGSMERWRQAAPRASRGQKVVRWALAAGLAGTALLFGSSHGWRGEMGRAAALADHRGAGADGAAGADGSGVSVPALRAPAGGRLAADREAPVVLPASSRSSIEGLSRPEARVYQIDGPQMSVVMIVDDKLDV